MGTVRTTSRRLLLAGLGASLAVHFGVGFVARVTPVAGAASAPDLAQPVETAFITLPDEPERVELGLEESPHQTDTWLGFVDPSDHQAPESEVEQSALTPLLPGAPAAPGATPTPELAASTEQAEAPDPADEPAEPVESDIAAEPAQADPEAAVEPELPPVDLPAAEVPPSPPEIQGPDQLLEQVPMPPVPAPIDPAELLAAPTLLAPLPAVELLTPPEPEGTPDLPRSEPADAPPQSETPPREPQEATPDGSNTPPGEGGETGGEKSPSESSATSTQRPVDVRPGRVAAAQGLQITTVRPAWDLTTMALAQPRSPTLIIEFGKDGSVRRARFLPGRSTGEPSVDRPLLDAIYRWTAEGEALDRLTDDEHDTVSITMRILLR